MDDKARIHDAFDSEQAWSEADRLAQEAQDLRDEAIALRKATNKKIRRATIEFRILAFGVALMMAALGYLTVLTYNETSSNHQALNLLKDSTTPGGLIYEQRQANTAKAVDGVNVITRQETDRVIKALIDADLLPKDYLGK